MYWNTARKPDMVAVAVGAFADPAFPAPSQAVYGEHRHRCDHADGVDRGFEREHRVAEVRAAARIDATLLS